MLSGYLYSWMSGDRPEFFPFENVDAASWDTYFAPGQGHGSSPNPFDTQPYGIDLPGLPGNPLVNLDVVDWEWQNVDGVYKWVDYHFPGVARSWLINPNPVAVDNNAHLNAAQLRGNFQYNIQGPDYDYLAPRARHI